MPTNRNGNEDQETQQPTVGRTRSRRRSSMPLTQDMRTARRDMIQQRSQGTQQGGQQQQEQTTAWEEFLEQLEPFFQEVGDKVRVLDRAGWVKIENPQTGHKLYFNKGVTGVTRVESSLAPGAVRGAAPPEFYNGRITSIIPANVQSVGEAIRVIAQAEDRLTPPRRRTRDIG